MIARVWRYMRIAKFGYLGWSVSFIISLVTPGVEKGRGWWWGQAGVLLAITLLLVGVQWFFDAKYGRRED